jgi:UDP-glucose 4-epimerase
VGSVLVEHLVERGRPVVVLDSLVAGHAAAVHPGAALVRADLRDRAALDALLARHRVEAVVHAAARALIPESLADPAAFYAANVVGSLALADALRAHGVRTVVVSSTAAVYGEPARVPLDEDHPTRPINPYGETKLAMERMLAAYARAYGLAVTVFRYFNAAGASARCGEAHRPETHLIPLALAARAGGPPLRVHGLDYETPDGSCIRDFVHVEDLAAAHAQALAAPNPEGFRVLNLGGGSGHSVLEVLAAVERVTGGPVPRLEGPRRPGDPARLVASTRRAAEALGWAPRAGSLEAIVESAWRWRRRHPAGYAATA